MLHTVPSLSSGVAHQEPVAASQRPICRSAGPWLVVAAAVTWNLANLRTETVGVAYLNDSSLHQQMVRFAALQLRTGHLPLTSWFPYLGLGSPQFLHYQSLPAMLTGLLGLAVGADPAFRWTLFVLVSVWPVSIYISARLFGCSRWAAASAAALSPFLVSAVGVGYEQKAYVWTGYGVWTQLWASLTLPLAWGFSWRAIREGRHFFAAAALVAITIALHFETGYLAVLPLFLWPLVAGSPVGTRVRRSALLACGVLLTSAWVTVPLIVERNWAATNEILRNTALVNGYGADRVLGWLFSGRMLDDGRIPIVTVLAGVGLVLVCLRWRRDAAGRALVAVLVGCLLLSFGRTTLGTVVDAIPGGSDIFFRRFMMGAQLAALMLGGIGLAWLLRAMPAALVRWMASSRLTSPITSRPRGLILGAIACVTGILVLAPAWTQLAAHYAHNTSAINKQSRADVVQGRQVDQLIEVIRSSGGGRVYAGMPSNWGVDFTVGAVPVFKYLESRDVDEIGYILRTASLMTDAEYYFDDRIESDYSLFGIHYLILPTGRVPPVPARLVRCVAIYCLWQTQTVGYAHAGTIVGVLSANRTNVGERSAWLLRTRLAQTGEYLRVSYGSNRASTRFLPSIAQPRDPQSAGGVAFENDNLVAGKVSAIADMRRAGVLVLSASYDPGWQTTVDGKATPPEMIAPALVATAVPPGRHTVVFRYVGFDGYLELFALGGLALIALLAIDLRHPRTGLDEGRVTHDDVNRLPVGS